MNGTTIEYTIAPGVGVILNNVQTREFAQEAVYDDSNTDVMYQKFRITVAAMCHTQVHTGLTADQVGAPYAARGLSVESIDEGVRAGLDGMLQSLSPTNAGATAQERAVRQILQTKGGMFVMRFGGGAAVTGKVILAAKKPSAEAASLPNGSDPIDVPDEVNNGPKPLMLKIVSVANDRMLKIEWSVEVCVAECVGGSTFASGILSNRWSMQDTIDSNFYTTRRISGRVRTRSALTNPHNYRALVLPPLDDGFRRESATFGATADGLYLEYVFVDREVAFAAPFPATSWSLTHRETCGPAIEGYGEVHITLSGPRNADKFQMIGVAAAIIQSRLLPRNFFILPTIKELSVTDNCSTEENSIEVHATAWHPRVNVAFDVLAQQGVLVLNPEQLKPMGAIANTALANYNRDVSRDPGISGTASLAGAVIAALQSACDDRHAYRDVAVEPVSSTGERTSRPTTSSYIIGEIPEPDFSYMSVSHLASPYLHYDAQSAYASNSNVGPTVIARTSSNSEGEATVQFFRLSKAHWKRTLTIEAIRLGATPQFPEVQSFTDENGIQHVLLSSDVTIKAPELMADQTVIHSARYVAVYGMSRPPTATERLRTAGVPWLESGSVYDTRYPSDLFGLPPG